MTANLMAILPFLVLAGGALLVMVVDSFVKSMRKDHLSNLTLLILLGALVSQQYANNFAGELFDGLLTTGLFTFYMSTLFIGIALLTVNYASSLYSRSSSFSSEFYPLILLSTLGMCLMVAATDLLVLFIGIEMMSMAVYLMVAGNRKSIRSVEAGFKYLILGAFASAILLMGMALLYGQSGSTEYASFVAIVNSGGMMTSLAVGLLLIGFGFKIAMVPFHMWTPDVYDGAPSHITGYMATGVKAAAMASMLRLVWVLIPQVAGLWAPLLGVLAVLTMTIGNLVALSQSNIKRMLAWSSIAHAGYLMLGLMTLLKPASDSTVPSVIADNAGGAILFYLLAYSVMNLGAFGVISYLSSSRKDEADQISRLAGLSQTRPLVAACLAIFMFSLAGIPPTIGFAGKFYIFEGVVKAGMIPLAIWGVVNSLLSAYYYLRVIIVMYMKDPEESSYTGSSWETAIATSLLAIITLLLGVVPASVRDVAVAAFKSLGQSG
jgi:NADH-quinone oxidoreductase subunit N